jgi:hypothetical protein
MVLAVQKSVLNILDVIFGYFESVRVPCDFNLQKKGAEKGKKDTPEDKLPYHNPYTHKKGGILHRINIGAFPIFTARPF